VAAPAALAQQGRDRTARDTAQERITQPEAFEDLSRLEPRIARRAQLPENPELYSRPSGDEYNPEVERLARERAGLGPQGSRADRQAVQGARAGLDRVEGTVTSIGSVSSSRTGETHILARIETDEGRVARVDLGPQTSIKRVPLRTGQRITLYGVEGMLDQTPVLVARRVEIGQQLIEIHPSEEAGYSRYQGTILDTRIVETGTEPYPERILARVRLDDGSTAVVNLGAREDMPTKLLTPGTEISMLARPEHERGWADLAASRVMVDGQEYMSHLPEHIVEGGDR
jgi:hypothetical protein